VSVEEIQALMASETGRTLRRMLAGGMILLAPMVFRAPGLRRYPLFRALELVGGVALVIKLAEALRDWEPDHPRPIVLEVPAEGPS